VLRSFRSVAPVLPALLIFAGLGWWLNFTQDDAYITYRYAANYLGGHGLVFNIGERVEGFTNFGWLTWLLVWGGLHLDFIFISKLTGFLLGLGTIVVTFLTTRRVFDDSQIWLRLLPPYLIAINLSLAYWSPAGLETAAFVFMTALCLYWFLTYNWLLIAGLALAAWIRPEGAFLAAIFIAVEFLTNRRLPKFALACGLAAFVISLPFAAFKLLYYGSVFPNPFFAKTGLSADQIGSGLGYAWEFLRHYGFAGLSLLIPIIAWKNLSRQLRVILLVTLLYSAYIVLVGGDVLKVHRFFLPIVGAFAILAAASAQFLIAYLPKQSRLLGLFAASIVMFGLTVYLPYETVSIFNHNERGFTAKMSAQARFLKSSDSRNFSVALPTIGIFGYELLGHDIIDMVGLTDSTIARHPEPQIPGLTATWKERRHNARYLLARNPDYVVFSTGVKPSAPAEQVLMMYPEFVMGYRQLGWFYQDPVFSPQGMLVGAFKRVHDLPDHDDPVYPLAWVQAFKAGQEAMSAQNFRTAVDRFEQALKVPGCPSYPELLNSQGTSYLRLRQDSLGVTILERALQIDSATYGVHRDLNLVYTLAGDSARANFHREWLKKLVPWYLPRADFLVSQAVQSYRRATGQNPGQR